MSTIYKPYTISELVDAIYCDNIEHFHNADSDCDCNLHTTISTIIAYWGE